MEVTCGKEDISLDPSWTKFGGLGEGKREGERKRRREEEVEREALLFL